jgi:rare lipoprotein A
VNTHIRTRGRNRARALILMATAGLAAAGASIASAATGTPLVSDGSTPPRASEDTHSKLLVVAREHVLSGDRDPIHGVVKPGKKGRVVWVQARRPGGGGWHLTARAETKSNGRFETSWKPGSIAHYDLRLVLPSTGGTSREDGGVTVYRASAASWYGPGFYGHRTACGSTLEPGTLGVANKTLPCGTKVRFYYHGHTVTAPVIDRGPYSGNREYDLTAATKNRLHFGSTGTVWSSPQS